MNDNSGDSVARKDSDFPLFFFFFLQGETLTALCFSSFSAVTKTVYNEFTTAPDQNVLPSLTKISVTKHEILGTRRQPSLRCVYDEEDYDEQRNLVKCPASEPYRHERISVSLFGQADIQKVKVKSKIEKGGGGGSGERTRARKLYFTRIVV